jgi:hypothetical protein
MPIPAAADSSSRAAAQAFKKLVLYVTTKPS